MSFDIKNLIPEKVEIKLSLIKEPLVIKPCTIGMLSTIEKRIKPLSEILENPSLEDICKVVFLLLENKEIFKMSDEVDYDLDGNEIPKVAGYKLLMEMIANANERVDLFKAVLESMGFKNEMNKIEGKKKPKKKSKIKQIG